MNLRRPFFPLLVLLAASPAVLPAFALRNTDPSAVFYYWTVPLAGAGPASGVLPGLPLAPGGRHGVAPGERVKILLDPGYSLVGTFVPWADNLSFRTPLAGGFILGSEAPAQGTVQVDRNTFAAANRGRAPGGTLQDWGLTVPQFVLDGQANDWAKVKPLVGWGDPFFKAVPGWGSGWPKPRTLQAVDREGALWLRIAADKPWDTFPKDTGVSLVLRRPGAFLEWPLTGAEGTVWSWTEADTNPAAAGWRILRGSDLEAWVPWDRLGAGDRKAWTAARGSWALAVTAGGQTRTIDLAPAALGDWP